MKETCGFFHNYDQNLPNTYPEPLIVRVCGEIEQIMKELKMGIEMPNKSLFEEGENAWVKSEEEDLDFNGNLI